IEIERGTDMVGFDPERASLVNERTDLLNRLMRKHRLDSIDKLIELRELLSNKLVGEASLDDTIRITKIEVDKLTTAMMKYADEIHAMREKAIPSVRKKVVELAREIGLKNAEFQIRLTTLPEGAFRQNGRDAIEFLFSANKGSEPQALDKVASGGELSRLMLCIKSLLAEKSGLPTLVFDEIDTGVSGEIAHKIGSLIHEMSKGRQVFVITHLPQMAAHGDDHLLVSKKTTANKTNTNLERLSKNERVDELARMLSGEILTEAARANARELLDSNR
ncbi:MAG: DNA repair protein RecN, partial [Bacteroidota bacterium]